MWWIFPIAVIVFTIFSATDLNASSFDATEIAKCMIAKSPYSGSFDRWDYADYCGGADMTNTERMEIQCKIDELTGMNYGNDTDADVSCKCSPPDYYGGGFSDLLERSC
jgi:hypothetical protein